MTMSLPEHPPPDMAALEGNRCLGRETRDGERERREESAAWYSV